MVAGVSRRRILAGIAAVAIEDTPRVLEYREKYPCVAAVVPGTEWQKQCNAQYLKSFETYEPEMAFPTVGGS